VLHTPKHAASKPARSRTGRTRRARDAADPVLVEVTRGEGTESRHRGAAAVFDSQGRAVASWGDIERPVFPRSAVKPLQVLPLIESGAAEAFGVSDAEIALACASHGGEPEHVAVAAAWLGRLGLGADALECGAHAPTNIDAAEAMIRAGEAPSALHNNCSGKHCGMIATALHLGEPVAGYVRADHPVQRRLRTLLGELGGVDLASAIAAVDGCSIPTIAMPLAALARAMARFADPDGLAPARAGAARRAQAAMAAHSRLVAGSGRFCTIVIEATGGAALVKSGAEGVFCAALPGLRLGFALKIEDGAGRAAEVATAALLRHLGAFDSRQWAAVAAMARPTLRNRNDIAVGEVRPAEGWL